MVYLGRSVALGFGVGLVWGLLWVHSGGFYYGVIWGRFGLGFRGDLGQIWGCFDLDFWGNLGPFWP